MSILFVSRYLRKSSSNSNLIGVSYERACAGRSGASWPLLSYLELGSTNISAALFADFINSFINIFETTGHIQLVIKYCIEHCSSS